MHKRGFGVVFSRRQESARHRHRQRGSIAFGCAKAFRDQGADLAVTYQNDKAEKYVRPLAEELGAGIILPLDVRDNDQYSRVFDAVSERWRQVDICLHSVAFCPKDDLHARVVDCSREGFATAMDISVYSFIRMVRCAEPLMTHCGTCMTVSYLGADKVVEHYNVMGPVKAALESATRYMAAEPRAERHQCERSVAWAAQDACCLRHRSFRRFDEPGLGARADPSSCDQRRCRRIRRVSCQQ